MKWDSTCVKKFPFIIKYEMSRVYFSKLFFNFEAHDWNAIGHTFLSQNKILGQNFDLTWKHVYERQSWREGLKESIYFFNDSWFSTYNTFNFSLKWVFSRFLSKNDSFHFGFNDWIEIRHIDTMLDLIEHYRTWVLILFGSTHFLFTHNDLLEVTRKRQK